MDTYVATVHVICSPSMDKYYCKLVDAFPKVKFIFLTKFMTQCGDNLPSLTDEGYEMLADCRILFVHLWLVVPERILNLPKLVWVQAFSAGVDKLTSRLPSSSRSIGFRLTRMGGVFDYMVAEYLLAQIVCRERELAKYPVYQSDSYWQPYIRMKMPRLLRDLTITIVGFGLIAKLFAKIIKCLGSTVHAVVKERQSLVDSLDMVDAYWLVPQLDEALSCADYVVNLLPETSETIGFFDGDVLKACAAKKPVLVNVGRGSAVREETLLKALEEQWISGAILDVFEKEPLPPDSKLWTTPGVTITPHIAGFDRPGDIVKVLIENLSRFIDNKPLLYEVYVNNVR